jgi:biopolymer transport protein ExbD
MRFPRNARIFRGQLEAAPFMGVFFLLLIFVLLGSLVYTPGVRIELPVASNLPGAPGPTIAVAVDAGGQFFFQNQPINDANLKTRLAMAASETTEPLTLVIMADKAVDYENVVRLESIAREAGLAESLHAILPRVFESPPSSPGTAP